MIAFASSARKLDLQQTADDGKVAEALGSSSSEPPVQPEPAAAPASPPRMLRRQGAVRNIRMADVIGVAAAHSLVLSQPLDHLSAEDARLQRKRMFVWMLKWKRQEAAQAAKERTQRCTHEVAVCAVSHCF